MTKLLFSENTLANSSIVTFLGPLKIFLNPLPSSLDLSLGFPERPLCPSVPPGLESSEKSKASDGETRLLKARKQASIYEWSRLIGFHSVIVQRYIQTFPSFEKSER